MRRFNVHCVTEIDFVDGDAVSDAVVQNYQKRLAETVQDAAHNLSLRTLKVPGSRGSWSKKSGAARPRQPHKWT
jgi:hypothetical protein